MKFKVKIFIKTVLVFKEIIEVEDYYEAYKFANKKLNEKDNWLEDGKHMKNYGVEISIKEVEKCKMI